MVDGTMYFTTGGHTAVHAVDAATGKPLWEHTEKVAKDVPACCDWVNRGLSLAGGKVASGDALTQAQPVPGITLTRPYYNAGYVLVRRVQTPPVRQLADLDEERIAVEMVSIPMYTLKQRGLRVFAVDDHAAVIDAVADGRANYGYLWGPIAEWDLRDRDDIVIERQFKPEERWDFAMAVRADDHRLKEEIDSALVALDQSGELAKVFVPDAL